MNILLIAPLLGYWGGTEQYMVDCLQEFTRMGHSCFLVYGSKSTKPLEQGVAGPDIGGRALAGRHQFAV